MLVIKTKQEKMILKRKCVSSMALYDGQPRGKEELYKQAGEIIRRLLQHQPVIEMAAEILKLTSELKDVDPIFNKLFLFKYPVELNDLSGKEFAPGFVKWAVEEGLAPAEEEEQLATQFDDLAIINGIVTQLCYDYHLLVPKKIANLSGTVCYLFKDTDSDDGMHPAVKIDQFKNEALEALYPNTHGEVPMCMALFDDDKNFLDFIVTTTKTLVPKQLTTPPSDIELAITAEPGNDCWTVYSHETGDFYDFHAKSQVQAAKVREARSGDITFTAHGFAYNPNTGYYEADYLEVN